MSEHTHELGGGWAVTQWRVPGCPACNRSESNPVSSQEVAAVLAEHVLHAGGGNHWYAECLSEWCDWSEQGTGGLLHGIEAHRTHVAETVTALFDQKGRGPRLRS